MSDSVSPMQAFKDNMARSLYGTTAAEAIDKGICIQCGEAALEKCTTDAGRREYKISGLCEPCFDGITAEPGDIDLAEEAAAAERDDNEAFITEAERYGYIGMFSDRKTMQEACTYSLEIADLCAAANKAHVVTAIHVMLNTHALEMVRTRRVIRQLEEMARASLSYCQDGSRSDGRRMRMIKGAQEAIEAAKPYVEE